MLYGVTKFHIEVFEYCEIILIYALMLKEFLHLDGSYSVIIETIQVFSPTKMLGRTVRTVVSL